MIRLKDIALKAGVSVMTVSKVLRDASDISVETKTRVRQLAQQMGYVPDSMAQGLRTRKTRLLGVVISAITNPVLVRLVMAIEERAYEQGYDVILAHSLNQPQREETSIRRLLSRRVDGLIILPVYRMAPTAGIFEELEQREVPTVIVGPSAPFCARFCNVEADDLEGSYRATQHLIRLGHRRIAYFTGPPLAPWAQSRLEGYRRALREAGLDLDDNLVFNGGSTIEEGEKTAEQMLAESPQVTAIQAVYDLVAMGAANVLLRQGYRIPEDISIMGFGDFLASEHFRVPLTTVIQPKARLGEAAMACLIQMLKGEPPVSRKLPVELVVRDSTAPPKQTPT